MDINTTQEINNWLSGDRNYNTGIALLQRYGKNKILAAGLAKAGKERSEQNHKKLAYELGKLVGSNQLVVGSTVQSSKPNLQPVTRNPQPATRNPQPVTLSGVEALNPELFPPVIRRIKYEYAEQYRNRDIQHKKMAAVPTENNAANNQARAAHLAEVKVSSARMEELYTHLQAFETNGTLPDENLLWPKPKQPEQLPDDAARLKLMKKNLQTANGKDRNLLEYQTERKGDKETPMPDGPKRKRIELRIKEREKQIAEIEDKLFELEIR